jgi:hypothetical protein
MGMTVSNADNGMATIKVKIFLSIVVPYLGAFAFDDIDVKKRINVV